MAAPCGGGGVDDATTKRMFASCGTKARLAARRFARMAFDDIIKRMRHWPSSSTAVVGWAERSVPTGMAA